MGAPAGLRDSDFFAWTQSQARILRDAAQARLNAPDGLDWEHLAEEIEALGSEKVDELYSRYLVLLCHLIKWRHQPRGRGGSWRGTIGEQRRRIARLLRKNPSLRPRRRSEFLDAYPDAREAAADESGLALAAFPEDCPFTMEQAEDGSYWPNELYSDDA